MKRMFKNMVAVLLIVMANIVCIYDTTCDVYADVHMEKEEFINRNIFVKEHKKYKNVSKAIQKEVNKHSTVAKKEVEKYLNEQGIFDDEIAGLYTDEDLRDLKIDDLYNTDVYVSYYAIEDKEELTGCAVEEEEMLELTDEQVDKYLAEKYLSEETNLYEELDREFQNRKEIKKKSVVDKVMEAIGLKPIEAYAAITAYDDVGGIDDKETPSMLKKIWMAKKSSRYILVNFEAVWTKMPKYRNLDVIYIEWDYGKYYEIAPYDDVEVTHFWRKQLVYVSSLGERIAENVSYRKTMKYVPEGQNLKNNQYNIREDYLCAAINLHDDYEGYSSKTMEDISNRYVNEGVNFKFYVRPEEGMKKMTFYLRYNHTIVDVDIASIAISTITGGKSGLVSVVCELASGGYKTVKSEISGVDQRFIFNFK